MSNDTTAIIDNSRNAINISAFHLTLTGIVLSLATTGFGNHIFGFTLFTDVSTIFIFITLVLQIIADTFRFPKLLIFLFIYIFIQTFVYNFFYISILSSLKQYIGLIIFSLSIFSFVSVYRDRLIDIVRVYYQFVFIDVCIAILQDITFIFSGKVFLPQNIIAGYPIAGQNTLSADILGILPRVVGLSTEPASYSIIILPGVFISLMILSGRGQIFGFRKKVIALIILLGFILSFSLVGYFGLLVCLLLIFAKDFKKKFKTNLLFSIVFLGILYFIFQTKIGTKVDSFFEIQKNITGYKYTSSDLSAFALFSNVIVAKEGLIRSHYLGTGLNSHEVTYNATIYNQFLPSQVIMELNKQDAGSIFIRLASEFGIPGLMAFLAFLYCYRIKNGPPLSSTKYINNMSLGMIISYSVRDGGYLNVFFLLFLALFYYSFILNRNTQLVVSGKK